MLRELIKAAGFRFLKRRYGTRITWPRRTRLADVLALYDLLEVAAGR